ncbi:MAG: hypothetical protein K2O58_04050 [Bacteroidales bacterium]|nr:hypothetical protein [Bacteroidales bacterium]MDE7127053.1 hypothetical protein [Bacteroidales bacterium]
MSNKLTGIITRYAVATLGLILVAIGVAFSIKSDLGTSPISCPPYVLSLWGGLTVGQYTICMHLLFVCLQILLLRKKFKAENLLQLVASFLFGFLTDGALWLIQGISVSGFADKFYLMLLSCVITAVGISIEVRAKAWMLAGEMTTAAFAEVTGSKFSNVKIIFDISLVIIAALTSWAIFGNPLAAGEFTGLKESLLAQQEGVIIGIGTIVSAFLTGLLMKLIDPATEFVFGGLLDRASKQSAEN